jgi:hypothetical protein
MIVTLKSPRTSGFESWLLIILLIELRLRRTARSPCVPSKEGAAPHAWWFTRATRLLRRRAANSVLHAGSATVAKAQQALLGDHSNRRR